MHNTIHRCILSECTSFLLCQLNDLSIHFGMHVACISSFAVAGVNEPVVGSISFACRYFKVCPYSHTTFLMDGQCYQGNKKTDNFTVASPLDALTKNYVERYYANVGELAVLKSEDPVKLLS